MNRTILGISAFYHDSAAALVRNGEVVAAAQEERFTRKKYDPRFPSNAINFCLEKAFIDSTELDAVVYYENPLCTFDRVFKNALFVAPAGEERWAAASNSILGVKARIKETVEKALGSVKLLFATHHDSHAASAFYPSPFDKAAILTADGVGEWATTTIGIGKGTEIRLLKEIHYPHSLGLFYSAMTSYCGFRVNSGEHKLMGLAPYGKPVFVEKIKENLIDIKEDGSFRLNLKFFGFLDSDRMTNSDFHKLFGGEPRKAESAISQREMDLAASAQCVLEEAILKLARHAARLTGQSDVVMAGGVALNCVANSKILNDGIFENMWIEPAAGDAGGALGAALLAYYRYFREPRIISRSDSLKGGFIGPEFSSPEVRAFLERRSLPYEHISDEEERARFIASALAEGRIVGCLAGPMEFGPRALGARSILADPRVPEMQSRINRRIKFRESFRPFAPAVTVEKSDQYFDLKVPSPYMMLTASVLKDKLPAITHVDGSARIQTVDAETNPRLYRILKAFEEKTGCPVLVNTSFNVRGEPIVCTPSDAYRCFMNTDLDVLVLEDCILLKDAQPPLRDEGASYYEPD